MLEKQAFMTELIGRRIGQYEITELIGEGGMAKVYRARQANVDRDAALKVIKPTLALNPEFIRRFTTEARTIAALNHPHILKVFEFSRHSDVVYLAMDYQSGGSLAMRLHESGLTLSQTVHLFSQIADALDYAHSRNVIHRDLKPENVLLDERDNAYLSDFGIAKTISDAHEISTTGLGGSVTVGTPAYMAPEQWQRHAVDARADLYALGILLYEMISGKRPFDADNRDELMNLHLHAAPPSLRRQFPNLPAKVDAVIATALAKHPEDRYQSAREFLSAFRVALKSTAPRRHDAPAATVNRATASTLIFETPFEDAAAKASRQKREQRRNLLLIGGSLLVFGVAVMVAMLGSQLNRPNSPAQVLQAVQATQTSVAEAAAEVSYTPTASQADLEPTNLPITPTLHQESTAQATTFEALAPTVAPPSPTAPPPTPTLRPTFTPPPPTMLPTAIAVVASNAAWTPQAMMINGVEMLIVPPGCFNMGDEQGAPSEQPITRVCFDKPFLLDRTEVTNAQFAKFGGIAEQSSHWNTPERPREQVTWQEAAAYCAKRGARLPTEAEWEYAARGVDNLTYPWGNAFNGDNTVYANNAEQQTAPVGTRSDGASWVGALDMSGNVWEWTSSAYRPYPYNAEDGREAADGSGYRVLRGGSWYYSDLGSLRAAHREVLPPTDAYFAIGFRCARDF